jgi:glycerophosphoryl diester phosphodiesterase
MTATFVIAHRGGSAYAPKDTIAVFQLAGERGEQKVTNDKWRVNNA